MIATKIKTHGVRRRSPSVQPRTLRSSTSPPPTIDGRPARSQPERRAAQQPSTEHRPRDLSGRPVVDGDHQCNPDRQPQSDGERNPVRDAPGSCVDDGCEHGKNSHSAERSSDCSTRHRSACESGHDCENVTNAASRRTALRASAGLRRTTAPPAAFIPGLHPRRGPDVSSR